MTDLSKWEKLLKDQDVEYEKNNVSTDGSKEDSIISLDIESSEKLRMTEGSDFSILFDVDDKFIRIEVLSCYYSL